MKLKAIFLWMIFSQSLAVAQTAKIGQRKYSFFDKNRNRTIETLVWYPASYNSEVVAFKKGPFLPVEAAADAAILNHSSKYPVVLLSHGSGGTADKMFWLAEFLVKNGKIIVIAVNHPGNMTGDNSGDGILRVWERPLDLTFALNNIADQAEFKDLLDLKRVAAAGHSAGGTTALHLAGARFDYERFTSPMPNCEGAKDPFVVRFCNEIKEINPKSYGRKTIEGDYSDSRVKAVAAYDPGQARSYNKSSLEQMGRNALVFIASDQPQSYDQIYTKEFLKLMPNSIVEIVPNSVHMSFLQPCHKNFPKDNLELRELCGSGEKEKIQSAVAEKTLRHFQLVWKQDRS